MKSRDYRLIAEFMGWTTSHPFIDSWDWLMPVVIKIVTENNSAGSFTSPTYMSGNNKYTFEILPDQQNGVYAVGDNMFEAAYTAVVEFIKNNQNHKR